MVGCCAEESRNQQGSSKERAWRGGTGEDQGKNRGGTGGQAGWSRAAAQDNSLPNFQPFAVQTCNQPWECRPNSRGRGEIRKNLRTFEKKRRPIGRLPSRFGALSKSTNMPLHDIASCSYDHHDPECRAAIYDHACSQPFLVFVGYAPRQGLARLLAISFGCLVGFPRRPSLRLHCILAAKPSSACFRVRCVHQDRYQTASWDMPHASARSGVQGPRMLAVANPHYLTLRIQAAK